MRLTWRVVRRTGAGQDDLGEISEGSAAAAVWPSLVCDKRREAEAASLREALLAYCERDTLALVGLHRVLWELV